jgi:tricarballylate dehydrogenase
VLERATKDGRGGNTRWSGAYLRLQDPVTPVDTLVEYGMTASRGHARRDYYETFAQRVPETFRWVQDRGVRLQSGPTIFITMSAPRYQPVGGGKGIVDPLFARLEETDAEVLYETTAKRLVLSETREITGVQVVGPDGRARVLSAPSVILACGGFQGNRELMTRYVGRNAYRLPPISRGGRNNQGDGLLMALEAGAATDGQFDLIHAEPKDPRSTEVAEAVVMTFPYGVLVDVDGRRFIDEASGTVDMIYERTARAIFEQPDSIAYAIFDQKMLEIPGHEHAILTDVEPYRGETLGELADAIGVPREQFESTVGEYNAACVGDQATFDWSAPDRLGARPEGQPVKSNWARPIDVGPFFAYPQVCANVFTFGGVRTDLEARVVDSDAHVIEGLYAAGEMTGLYFEAYAGSTSVMRSLVFGRQAGRNAVAGLA